MKIVGYTVSTPLPKPNFDQTDPHKGDFIKGDRSFITPDDTLTESGRPADAKATGDAIVEIHQNLDTKVGKIDGMGLSSNDFTDEEKERLNSPVPTDNIIHGEYHEQLSNIIDTYILSVDYSALAFDTSEIVFETGSSGGSTSTTSMLGYAVLGKMILG